MWECKRCGDCCKYVAEKKEWKRSEIDETEKEYITGLLEGSSGCEALTEADGVYSCLVQELYGFEAKPPGCRSFTEARCKMTVEIKRLLETRSI